MNKVLARSIITIAAVNDGKDGQTPHIHIAYANSPDGKVDFSTDDSKDRAYIGQYVSYTDEPDSTDAGMYNWSRIKGNDAVLYKLMMSGSQFNVKADGRFSPEFISIYAYKVQGENLTKLLPSENVSVRVTKGKSEIPLYKEESFAVRSDKWNLFAYKEDMADVFNVDLLINDKLADMQKIHVVRDGRNGVDGKDGINGEKGTDGKDGKDAVSYKLIPMQETAEAYKAKSGKKLVRLFLAYKVQKIVGELTSELTIEQKGMTLSVHGVTGRFEPKSGAYVLEDEKVEYKETNFGTYAVTLTKGSEIVARRIVPITFKPQVMFNIDTELGKVTSRIETVEGDVNEFQTTINETKSTVGNLQKNFTLIEQTSKELKLTVNNGTRPNLLWGSDLDLSEVQDKIQLAYDNGDVIQQNTAEKENLQRQLDATPTDDTAKRNDLQKEINACNDEIATAKYKVDKCKAAIEKHFGVWISDDMEIGNREMFQYLKGDGVDGSDAIRFKNAYKREDWAKWTNISWHDVTLKPHTIYTISVWVKFKSYGRKGLMYVDCGSDDGRYCFGGYLYKEHYYDRADIDEWQRVRYVFNSGASQKMKDLHFCCIADEEEGAQCELWLCRPKLEEGNKATPWCAYDGTVEALLATGLDIKNRKMIATTDNFVVQNNKGEQTFFVDEKGRINNGMLVSKLRLTEPTIITNENYQKFCYNGKLNGYNVPFLDLLKCGTLLVLKDVRKQLFLDLPSFREFKKYNTASSEEVAKEQYEKMRYIGNTIILYNINSRIVFVSGVLKYKRMAGVKDINYLDEFGFYTAERLPCRGSELACFECKFGITRPEGSGPWDNRQAGVYWEFCYVTTR